MNHKFRKLGCGETVKFTELRGHEEEACPYAPYSCPFDGCAYRGALLYDHVHDEHAQAPAPAIARASVIRAERSSRLKFLLRADGPDPVGCCEACPHLGRWAREICLRLGRD